MNCDRCLRDVVSELEHESKMMRLTQAEKLLRRVSEWTPAFPVEATLLDEIGAFLLRTAGQ